jgi:hypothetical protein
MYVLDGFGRRLAEELSMRASFVIALAACLAGLGCGRREASARPGPESNKKPTTLVGHAGDSSQPRSDIIPERANPAVATDKLDRNPTVSDDAKEIAEVRTLFERERDALYETFLDVVKVGGSVYSEIWAFEEHKSRAVAELNRLLSSDSKASDPGRAMAAVVLMRLGEPAGERFLFDSLRSRRPLLREAALVALRDRGVQPDFGDAERLRLVLSLVDDANPNVAAAAARLCVHRKLPGAEGKIVALLQSGRFADPRSVARDFIDIVESPAAVGVMLEYLLKEPPKQYDQLLGLKLKRLVEHPDPNVAEPVRTAYRKFALTYVGKDRLDFSQVRDLAMVADAGIVPLLSEIAANTRESICRVYAVEALARLHPENAVDRLIELVRSDLRESKAVDALRSFASEKDADRILAAVLLDERKRHRLGISRAVPRLLIERLGERGRAAALASMDQFEPWARMWALWKLNGLNLDMAIDDLRAAGVIAIEREPLLKRIRLDQDYLDEHSPLDLSDSDTLTEALTQADVLTNFDAETGMVPCDHDRLIRLFAKHSRGQFAPECVVQTWDRKREDNVNAPYTVRFLYRGRAYRFGAENKSDWYDVQAVYRALNFALATAGQKERFVWLATGGQAESFVFAAPEAFEPIAKKYGLPIYHPRGAEAREGNE